MEAGWGNVKVDSSQTTIADIIRENLFTYFNLIFLILAILVILVGSFNSLTFLPVLLANIVIGIVQQIRARNVLNKMNILAEPKAAAVRDGKMKNLPTEQLVRDDVVIFKSGGQVCADAEVIAGSVRVNESLLTGESDEITKKKGDRLISGSFIVSGQCAARLTEVGEDSYISKLTLQAKEMKSGEQSEMIRSLNALLKIVGIALIPIGIALFLQSYVTNGETLRDSITSMVAALIGMIPEGLYLLTTVALAVSSTRLASKGVLLHDMKSIETLARVDVLCVDKTGTITENRMEVHDFVSVGSAPAESAASGENQTAAVRTNETARTEIRTSVGSAVSAVMSDVTADDAPTEDGARKELARKISDFATAMNADNATMQAMKAYFTNSSGRKPVRVVPFSSTVKYSSVTFEEGAYVLGAPEFVLREDFPAYREEIEEYTSKGYRLVVFGITQEEVNGNPLQGKVTPLGYVLLSNPVRKEAPDTFRYFAEQGVEVKVISGDTPLTVVEAAKQAGIPNADSYVDASTLKTDADIDIAVGKYTVFGRVTPEQKRKFVRALKIQGRTVAMTGDGVNDILALKDADCSVAMASGSEAAAQSAQVVLLDSDFSCMPDVVAEGRRVVNNIQRTASLFLVKNIFSFLMSLFSVAFAITYPLQPSQISLISSFVIGIPAFFLSLMPNHEQIHGHFLSNVILKAAPAGITDVVVVGALVVFGQTFGVDSDDIATAATMLLAIVGFMILYKISKPMNPAKWAIWGFNVAGLLISSLFFPSLFSLSGMSVKCIMLFVLFAIATEPVLRYLTLLFERGGELAQNIRYRKR
ncbi:MAG: cation-translocating P-type ATPase [Lachnospiraceae bacterium]|nr:cation-translocating P-type ATPase [Lachnospiraceae bacterium]